jgi:protoporphyrinogen/coproporphyrinogen III oxidase
VRPDAPHVVVCGAGLTGLTTAWHLQRQGARVTVLEAGAAVGGVMRSVQRDGYLVERGPNSCMLTAELALLVDALGLTPQLRPAAPEAQRRFIVRDGRPLVVPTSPGAMLSSPLFSLGAKLRVLREPFIARRAESGDESVAAFVRRRLGTEPLTWAVDPFVSGVYAGDPERLSVRHAFPRLAALEREHGSIVRGAIAAMRRSRDARRASGVANHRPTMVSFTDGMGMLPIALERALADGTVRCRHQVTAVARRGDHLTVSLSTPAGDSTIDADAVISTLPLHALAGIHLPLTTQAAIEQLSTVPYPAVASLALGFRRSDVTHALDGFGCLIPSAEQRKTLGVLFSSTLFEQRAPDGHVLLTCFLGGTRHPALGRAGTEALCAAVLPELRDLLGVRGAPTFVEHTVWPQAIPQYDLGHDANAAAAERIEAAVPGLIVDGQFRRGVSVGDCVAAGERIAARALALAPRVRGAGADMAPVPVADRAPLAAGV